MMGGGRVAKLIVLLASISAGLTLHINPMSRSTVHAHSRAALVRAAEDGSVKVNIKKPSSTAASDSSSTSSGTKINVRVRPKSERKAASATTNSPAEVAASSEMSFKVSKPDKVEVEAVAAPPPAPEIERTPEEEMLLEAVQAANCSKILAALRAGANPNMRDPNGRTPLHFMAGVGLAPACVLLLHFGAQVDLVDEGGLTALHMAAGYANSQTLRVLIKAGANSEIAGKTQGLPIEVVCALGDYQYGEWIKSKEKFQNRFQKQDEKLEELKECMIILEDPQKVQEEMEWEEMLDEVLKVMATV